MKKTLDIASQSLRQAKAIARADGISMRALVERGLQLAIAERRSGRTFKLRDMSFKGKGLHPDAPASWDAMRSLI